MKLFQADSEPLPFYFPLLVGAFVGPLGGFVFLLNNSWRLRTPRFRLHVGAASFALMVTTLLHYSIDPTALSAVTGQSLDITKALVGLSYVGFCLSVMLLILLDQLPAYRFMIAQGRRPNFDILSLVCGGLIVLLLGIVPVAILEPSLGRALSFLFYATTP